MCIKRNMCNKCKLDKSVECRERTEQNSKWRPFLDVNLCIYEVYVKLG